MFPAILIVVALFLLDRRPHFMLGDSESYLLTDPSHLPPDRSWEFGLLCHDLLVFGHSLSWLAVLHLALLLATTFAALRLMFPSAFPASHVVVSAVAVCADPLLEAYARFQLSDMSAALLFVDFVLAVAALLSPFRRPGGRRRVPPILVPGLLAVLFGIGAVLLRVAYLPVEAGTLLVFAPAAWRARRRRPCAAALALLLVPLLALAADLELNHLAFAREYRDSFFTNRLSGIFLAGVFAPALRAEDFRRAGIAVTDAEVSTMNLGDYDMRIAQVWGAEPFWMRNVIARHLHATGEYDAAADHAAHRVVVAALRRDPAAIGRVYLHGLLLFALPDQWRQHVAAEMGAGHSFAPGTVVFLNAHSDRTVRASDPSAPSPLTRLLGAVIGAYPVLLMLGLLVAAFELLSGSDATRMLLAAALVADVAAAPLYSNFVIPRYLLAGVMVCWLIIPRALLAAAAAAAARPRARPA